VAVRVGEILVEQGACSAGAVRDALKNQIIFGGRLGTNLLEIQAVTEDALAKALGKQHGLACLSGPQRLDPTAVALLTPEIADRHDAVPFLVQGRRLALIVADPRNLATLDEIAFVTGKAVHPIVAAEARVWALLRDTYGIDRHLRGLEVDFAQLRRIDDARSLPAATPPPEPHRDLMDEGEFSALYAQPMTSRSPTPLPVAAVPPAPTPAPDPRAGRSVVSALQAYAPPVAASPAPLPPPARAPAPTPPPPPPTAPVRARAAPPAPAPPPVAAPPGPPDEIIELTELLEAEPWVVRPGGPLGLPAEVAAEVLAALDRAPGHAPPERLPVAARPAEPEPSPLSFPEAVRLLEGVAERDAIAGTVLRYARSKFKRAVLLTVHRGVAHGWAGLGEKLGREAVRRIHLALGQPGIVETVVKAQAHFLGPLPRTESNIRLLKALGGGVPGNALLLPILAMGRVVNLFYADNGKGGTVDSGDVGELLILATRIAKSYDALLGRVR
jgi:hypothetical protein